MGTASLRAELERLMTIRHDKLTAERVENTALSGHSTGGHGFFAFTVCKFPKSIYP